MVQNNEQQCSTVFEDLWDNLHCFYKETFISYIQPVAYQEAE